MIENERTLIEDVQSGQTDAFASLYEKYIDQVYSFIYYKTHHKETAQDLTSKTFTKALENISSLKAAEGSFRPWIYVIARNNVIDHYRTKKVSSNVDDIWDLAGDDDIERDAQARSDLANIEKYLSGIEPIHRDIILLRVWQEMSYDDISKIVGKTPDNCKVIFSRAIRKLRADLAMLLAMAFIRSYM